MNCWKNSKFLHSRKEHLLIREISQLILLDKLSVYFQKQGFLVVHLCLLVTHAHHPLSSLARLCLDDLWVQFVREDSQDTGMLNNSLHMVKLEKGLVKMKRGSVGELAQVTPRNEVFHTGY